MPLIWLLFAPKGGKPQPEPLQQLAQPQKVYTAQEVAAHSTPDDCWLIIDGKVFDVTPFVDQHPGGSAITASAGQDVTKGFHGPQHPTGAVDLVGEYQIGVLQR